MSASANHFAVRPDWLARHDEDAIDPQRPIVDAHHHLYDRPDLRYLFDDYMADISSGHDIRASVFVQARAMLRADGPAELRAIGETEWVNGIAAMSASGLYGKARICAGIVGYADLTLGDAVRPVLERHIIAGGGLINEGGRFRGIRQTLCWDRDSSLLNPVYSVSEDMMDSPSFRAGFAQLAPLGLGFEVWTFFPQLPAVARLARAFPETRIVLNHCGGVVRIHDYAGRADVLEQWKTGIEEVARCPNVTVKLSGLGMKLSGFDFDAGELPPTSGRLAEAWSPWIGPCLDAFGAQRCMWGSNFPVDKGSYALKIGLNALKRITSGASEDEKDFIFWRTASEFYRLPDAILNICRHGTDFPVTDTARRKQ